MRLGIIRYFARLVAERSKSDFLSITSRRIYSHNIERGVLNVTVYFLKQFVYLELLNNF